MNLVLFYVWEDARVWAHWNHSLDMHLNYLGPVSCFSPSSVLGVRSQGGYSGWWLDGHNILCLQIWQETFFKHRENCFLQASTVPSIHLRWPWSPACCPGLLRGHGRGPVMHIGMHIAVGWVLSPGTAVTALKPGTNTPALTSSTGVWTTAYVSPSSPPKEMLHGR